MSERVEWRFFWPHAVDEMMGAQPRKEPPTAQELKEWQEDFTSVWVERRVVHEEPWAPVPAEDLPKDTHEHTAQPEG